MTSRPSIELTDLLLRRELELVRVAECERAILGILGQAYPFPPPPPLPSLAKRKPTRRPKSEAPPDSAAAIRPLRQGESAYRVTWRQDDEPAVSYQADRALVQRLLRLEEPAFTILEVATVHMTTPENATVREILCQRA